MNYEDINYNEIIISGIINNITDTNDKYIKFSMVSKKYTTNENKNVYVSLNVSRELYNIFKDYFYKDNKVFVKGYLNSYIDKNKTIKSFITVVDIADNPNNIINGRSEPHIRYDSDGVEVWDGKRTEPNIASEEEQKEMQDMIDSIINERNECNMLENNLN